MHNIQKSIVVMARLDVLLARARMMEEGSYSIGDATANIVVGQIPLVGSEGVVDVEGFVHPLLLEVGTEPPVPVDLKLGEKNAEGVTNCGLVISGMNGGGKTLAMKSFGVAVAMVR
mmetsp:Transcript_18165/g.41389  ORF Transcript_18165/g.41389 Transcript_18165/m.41389 type:complete len:116 (+) Transcript_18165:471-818(+)